MMTMTALMVGLLSAAPVGCTKDTDCKGDRICEAGVCVNPPPAVAPPEPSAAAGTSTLSPLPPPPPSPPSALANPSDYHKVVRKNGVTCIQSLGDDGLVREDCRLEGTSYSGTRRAVGAAHPSPQPSRSFSPRVEQEEGTKLRRSRVTFDFGVGALGLIAAGSAGGILPVVALHTSVEGRVGDSVALGGLFNASFGFGRGFIGVFTFAPALRLGDKGHATLGLGPSVGVVGSGVGSMTGLMGTLLIHGVVPSSRGFGLHLQLAVNFDPTGAYFTLGAGFGGSSF
jgi:hypothetical protein